MRMARRPRSRYGGPMPRSGKTTWAGVAGLVMTVAAAIGAAAQPASPAPAGPETAAATDRWRLTPFELTLPTELAGAHPVAMRLAEGFRGQARCYVVLLRGSPPKTLAEAYDGTFRFHLATLPLAGGRARVIQSVTTRGVLDALAVSGDQALLSGFGGLVVMSPGRIERHGFGPRMEPWPDGKGESWIPVRVALMKRWALIGQGGKLSRLDLDNGALTTVVDPAGPAVDFGLSGQAFGVTQMCGDPARGVFWVRVSSGDRPDLQGVFRYRPGDSEPVKAFARIGSLQTCLGKTLLTGSADRNPRLFVPSDDGTRLIEIDFATLHAAWPEGLDPQGWTAASLGLDAVALLKPFRLRLADAGGGDHEVKIDDARRSFVVHPDPAAVLLLGYHERGAPFSLQRLERLPDARP